MTNLFKINATDLTAYEKTSEHNVNRVDVYSTWTDGNWIEHREIARTRITGTVTLTFPRSTDYTSFLALLTSEKDADGYYPITVYCSNTGTTETINAFLDVQGDTKWDLSSPRVWQGVTITIYQR